MTSFAIITVAEGLTIIAFFAALVIGIKVVNFIIDINSRFLKLLSFTFKIQSQKEGRTFKYFLMGIPIIIMRRKEYNLVVLK